MIVRNEAPVIERCLASVRPLLDYWVVIDTGSSDGTQDIVRRCLADVPGELIERPWVDFAHNRTEAFGYACERADYVLVIDADEVLLIEPGFTAAALTADSYRLESVYGGQVYARTQLLRSGLPWRYVGVVHEYPYCDQAGHAPVLDGLRVRVFHDGARARDPLTYRRDALRLEAALLEDPGNPRTVFYLAQSYRDTGDNELAIRNYQARARLGGWQDEVWYALYQVARLREVMGHPWGEVLDDYLAAYELQPGRAEPLYRLGMHYARKGADVPALLFLAKARDIPRPDSDHLFVDADVYDYRLPFEYAAACGRSGKYAEAIAGWNRLLRERGLPAERIEEVHAARRRVLAERGAAVLRPLHRPAQVPGPVGAPGGEDARIRICVPVQMVTDQLDDCLESIGHLTEPPCDVWIIDDGCPSGAVNVDGAAGRVPVRVARNEQAAGFDGSVDRFIREHCHPRDIVMPLTQADRFAAGDVLRHIKAAFADPACAVLYGQHRRDDGRLGDAEPAADLTDLARPGLSLSSASPLVFRAATWLDHVSAAGGPTSRESVLRQAGIDRTRFTDAVLTVRAAPTTHTAPAALTAPATPAATAPPRGTRPASPANPLVSCLMVTHDRLALGKRAIRCLARQTYSNVELVIVSEGQERYRHALGRYAAQAGLERVRVVPVTEQGLSLGALRNISLAAASGDIVCQWDDDDCYHPDRIAAQLSRMRAEAAQACYLTDHLQFLEDDRALVWVDWTLGGKSGRDQLLPGTAMMERDSRFRYPETGPLARRGEDSALLWSLYDQVKVASVRGEGQLYLYTYHGRNTFDRDHHHRMALFSLSAAELSARREIIRAAMAQYPVPRPFVVIGRDGPAFMLND
jgi:glycosyltransferase involved in cell wall biosynthesis